ncbi:2'-5' RNA ligase family protein [Actinacidiphila sp. DG2A-62]|uniref:2'-5' RNA ligase family protein n=1 Tax=Actinacidiphila sp. DG2A-62 TaxID=3108821 RepID=UPI002DBE405C|nr:2'-5' RNA ligase family protein [Actinacidiphila sp. DG2A-62]MEC3997211.1 2'-5' RNA ligase family protein [Actinacidiphila sp. DG2A-62]
MANHWWWRPGWSVGRRFYTWHLTWDTEPDIHRFAEGYRQALAPAGGLDLIPNQWLHLTMQGVGFVEDITNSEVEAISQAAGARLARLDPFRLTFGTPVIDPEAILVPVQPAEPVRRLRSEVRAAIGEVLNDVPESADGFTPHVSLAYSNTEGPAAPHAAAVADAHVPPATALVTHADLIIIHRDHQMYEWTTVKQVRLG